MLGFEDVYDYVLGKQDWLARGLPTEGRKASVPRAKDVVRSDVVTCLLDDTIGDVRPQIEQSPYPFALVVSETGVLLGRLRRSMLDCPDDRRAEQVMEAGPSTVRVDTELSGLVKRLRERSLSYAVVTLPNGVLVGVVRRSEAEEHISGE